MLGHSYPPSRRQRSFKKHYYSLFIIVAIILWRPGGFLRQQQLESDIATADVSEQVTPHLSPEAIDQELSGQTKTGHRHGHGHHVHLLVNHVEDTGNSQPDQAQGEAEDKPADGVEVNAEDKSDDMDDVLLNPIDSLDDALPIPAEEMAESSLSRDKASDEFPAQADSPAKDPSPQKNAVGPLEPASGSDSDIDGIDTLHRHSADNVVNDAKLTHPDDDAEGSDNDHPKFNGDKQSRLKGSKKDKDKKLDEILNADHPSKEHEKAGDTTEEETDVDDPIEIDPEDLEFPIQALTEMTPWSEKYTFPAWEECESIKEKADELPDLLYVPFEHSVRDVELEGWEDDWVAHARFTGPQLEEPKIDFVYNWINGSQPELHDTMYPYEVNSTLNDEEGLWLASHGTNRYREWDELRYSMRSVEKYAGSFTNRIQILVNSVQKPGKDGVMTMTKQRPSWLRDDVEKVQIVAQEEFFGPDEKKCLPSFDSLTIENQLYNTKSETDRMFALSDDMFLGKPHAASDIYSPLFGPTMGFKDNAYNTLKPPTDEDAERFGEKPFLIYTSWLLNRRFGARKRKGQVHFGHSLSRSIAKEAITSFPRPALRSAAQRFRGETGFQLYSWYAMFHYTMERHREALLWSYIMLRSDQNDDGYLSWTERKKMLKELAEGLTNETPEQFRRRIYYRVNEHLQEAGLEPPQVNTDVLWTSLDGPLMIKDLDCDAFDTEDCLAPGFSMASSDAAAQSPMFSSAAIFDRVARQSPRCGDCLIKLILNRRRAGLGPLLPQLAKKPEQRATVVKALMKYQYSVVAPDAYFYMVTDAEQAEHVLLKPYLKKDKKAGQICLNDDVETQDERELEQLRIVMGALFEGLLPDPSSFER